MPGNTLFDRLGLPGWAAALLALCLSAFLAYLLRKLLELVAMRIAKRKSA